MKLTDGKFDNGMVVGFFRPAFELPEVAGVTPEMEQKSVELLNSSRSVTAITSPSEQETAVEAGRNLRTWIKRVAEFGKAFRKPLKDFADRVKQVEDAHIAPLMDEQSRIERLVLDFQLAEQRRVEAAEKARQAAYAKAEADRIEAEAKAAKAAEKMQTDAGLAKALQAEEKAVAAEAKVQEIVRAPLPEKARANGAAIFKRMGYRVKDVRALYAARPELCVVEAKASAIRAVCFPADGATADKPDAASVPGLELWWEMSASLRTR